MELNFECVDTQSFNWTC